MSHSSEVDKIILLDTFLSKVYFDGVSVNRIEILVYEDFSTRVKVFGEGTYSFIDRKKRVYHDKFGDYHVFSCEKFEILFHKVLGGF